jgi:hypothetical protein
MESQRATMVAKVGTGLEMSWRSLAVEDLDRAMLDSLQKAYEESFGSPLSFSAGKRLVVEYHLQGQQGQGHRHQRVFDRPGGRRLVPD